ncbi:unnamed protein product [Paramecium primaurelia]|uniref:Actin-fragmin kinase catalytic domain-containing protein n=1 Tax=Paramecium primaurelia TaxID=5886 RepID=A0A8S1LEM5_PARPR|nr:unnamed protein product [Paramecium primaurelia]
MKQNKYIKNIHLRSKEIVEQQREQQNINKSQIQLQEFDYAAKPYVDFEFIKLKNIKSIKLSDSGSRGVLFIDSENGAIVLKLSGQVSVELYLNKLAQALDIKTTQMKCLKWCDLEMQEIKNDILFAASIDEVLSHRLKQKLKVSYFEMIEYIPGLQLYYFQGERAKIIFNQERLFCLGKIIGFDIFIHNGDRFPLPIWRSVGNAYNVILKVIDEKQEDMFNFNNINLNFECLYSIDPQTILKQHDSSIQDKILNAYIEKVKKFLQDICDEIKMNESQCLETFKDFIFEQTQYKLNNNELQIIKKGILYQIQKIVQFGIENIIKIKQDLLLSDSQDWMDSYNNNLNQIHIEFHEKLITVFADIINTNSEIFQTL